MGGRGEAVGEGDVGMCMESWLGVVVIGCTTKIQHLREQGNCIIRPHRGAKRVQTDEIFFK